MLRVKSRIEGKTILSAYLNNRGDVDQVFVVKPLGFALDEEAVDAVKRWKFQPAERHGQPVAVQINIEVTFRLQ